MIGGIFTFAQWSILRAIATQSFPSGATFFWAGYPERALVYLNEAVREQPDNGKAHLAIGYIHVEVGR